MLYPFPATANDSLYYFAEPIWGPEDASRGGSGTSMWVILGPHALDTGLGSTTSYTSIYDCMTALNSQNFKILKNGQKKGYWVAGHLLNDNLGGSGVFDSNLTPLTQTANKQHSGFEGWIKNAIEVAKSREKNYKDDYIFGVEYEVIVHDHFGDEFFPDGSKSPFYLAPSHITVQARLVKAAKSNRALSLLTPIEVESLLNATPDHRNYFRLFNAKFGNGTFPIEIHNDDTHLELDDE
ncbi:MAG: hypothetical protein HYZ45_13550 [Burkholderiales bacterium]|nr:hypothetical protein [Burkholderiales bacterium]